MMAVVEDATLEREAEQINQAHAEATRSLNGALEQARKCGELLIDVKNRLPYGRWLPWLAKHVEFSRFTAARYMRVASRWEELADVRTTTHLSFTDAVDMLVDDEEDDEPSLLDLLDREEELAAEPEEEAESQPTLAEEMSNLSPAERLALITEGERQAREAAEACQRTEQRKHDEAGLAYLKRACKEYAKGTRTERVALVNQLFAQFAAEDAEAVSTNTQG